MGEGETSTAAYPRLFEPLSIGDSRLRNRIVSTSHQTSLVHDHRPTDDLLVYHEARAAGGVGAVFLEAVAVHPTGLLTSHTISGFDPGIEAAYRRLRDRLQAHDTRLGVQLFHGGKEQLGAAPRAPAVAPSAIPSRRFKTEPRALDAAEIAEIVAGYGVAVEQARAGGVELVELSFSHGYLAAQFIAATSNRRVDGYGGTLARRLRFPREVIDAARQAAGSGVALGVRLAADEMVAGGLDAEACAEVAAALTSDGGLDFVSLALGHSADAMAATWIAPPAPATREPLLAAVAGIRAAVGRLPVIATTRVVDAAAAEALLATGHVDAVGMTRALIADPQLPEKVRTGSTELIECIGCNQACIGHYHAGLPIGCVVNPRTGRERRLLPASRTRRGRLLVVGGGPAGVAAALEGADHGYDVVLCEARQRLGGQLELAGRLPAHEEPWTRWLAMTERRLRARSVDVRLGTPVEDATEDWEGVVLAMGAAPYRPELTPPDGLAVIDGWSAIRKPEAVDGPVLVWDWGGEWTGLDAAEALARAGRKVHLACSAPVPGEQLHQYQRSLYLDRLDRLGVRIVHHHDVAVTPAGVDLRHAFSGRTQPAPPVATLVVAQGRVPAGAPARIPAAAAVARAGDVLGPRTLEEAILEGTMAVRDLVARVA